MITYESLMPFGKHLGKKLKLVPEQYLIWWHGELQNKCSNYMKPYKEWLDDNIEDIKESYNQKYPKPYFND